jgi:hypothetical protein
MQIYQHVKLQQCEQAARNRVNSVNTQMNVDDTNADNVKMIVLDGVVIAPTVNYINYSDENRY